MEDYKFYFQKLTLLVCIFQGTRENVTKRPFLEGIICNSIRGSIEKIGELEILFFIIIEQNEPRNLNIS